MKKLLVFLFLVGSIFVFADSNVTVKNVDKNSSKSMDKNLSKEQLLKEQLKKQMELEAKYAKEQKFYQGKDYNLKEKEIDEKTLKDVPAIEPDYDFDITDVYRDDQ